MAEHGTHAPGKLSTNLDVTTPAGEVTLLPEQMRLMPQTTVTVHNGHSDAEERYSGVKLSDLLAKAGFVLGKNTLHGYVAATGTDGYWVLYSGEEVSEQLHAGMVIVALDRDGKPLEGDGAFKLISTEDHKPERWVRNLDSLHWVEAKP